MHTFSLNDTARDGRAVSTHVRKRTGILTHGEPSLILDRVHGNNTRL